MAKPHPEKIVHDTVREVSVAIVEIERKLHNAGLHATAHKVNEATKKLGWEAAERIEKIRRALTKAKHKQRSTSTDGARK